ncbi:hypothetical protein D3C86_1437970 [compost metagenome]
MTNHCFHLVAEYGFIADTHAFMMSDVDFNGNVIEFETLAFDTKRLINLASDSWLS